MVTCFSHITVILRPNISFYFVAIVYFAELKSIQEQIVGIKDALTLLPPAHYNTLKYLMEHLNRLVFVSAAYLAPSMKACHPVYAQVHTHTHMHDACTHTRVVSMLMITSG